MSKEYPFFNISYNEIIEKILTDSVDIRIKNGERFFFIGFSVHFKGVWENFISLPFDDLKTTFKPSLEKMFTKLTEVKQLAEKGDSPITSVGWFLTGSKEFLDLDLRHTSRVD